MSSNNKKNYENFDNKPKTTTSSSQQFTEDELYQMGLDFFQGNNCERDIEKALFWLQEASSLGSSKAEVLLGYIYLKGVGVAKDIEKGLYWYGLASEKDEPEANFQLGIHCIDQHTEESYIKAVCYFTKAAVQYHPLALYALGLCYEEGKGVPVDYEKAFILFEKAAVDGDAGAQFKLGVYYTQGKGVEKDPSLAFVWYNNAANQGNVEAMFNLGVCYNEGNGVEEDKEKAHYWFKKAADKGDKNAYINLAIIYLNGFGVEKDEEKSLYYFEKAAECGNSLAQFYLGVSYLHGYSVEKDLEKAVYWLKQSAEQDEKEAQYIIAFCYEKGEGVEKDIDEAMYWYHRSAENGNEKAQFLLAVYYYNGDVIPQDYKKVYYWFNKAAENEHVESILGLGSCYEEGIGVEQDYEKAYHCFLKAAELGDAYSMFKVGFCYHDGLGVKEDIEESVSWFSKAADLNLKEAQYILGLLYVNGDEVTLDLNRGLALLKKAAEQGLEDAHEAYKKYSLKEHFTFGERKDIFISWNHFDVEYKDRINEHLINSHIVSCFESDGGCHGVVEEAVEDAINSSKMYLVILTGNSIKSKWVLKEVSLILEKVKTDHRYAQLVKPVVINVIKDEEGNDQYFDVIKAINESENEVFKELINLGTIFDNEFNKTLDNILSFAIQGLSTYKLINYKEKLLENLESFQATLKNKLWSRNGVYKGKTSASLSYSDEFVTRKISDGQNEYDIDYLLNQDSFLLSSAGSGKTILLNKLIYENYVDNSFMMRIPLKDVGEIILNSSSLLDVIAHMFDRVFMVDEQENKFSIKLLSKYLLECKDKYLFIDGLNELSIEQKDKLILLIKQYKEQYHNTRFIYTSRDINDSFLLDDITRFELLPISLDETKKLYYSIAKKFISVDDPIFLTKEEEFFLKLDQVDKDILGNPLLLSNLIIIFMTTNTMPLKYFDIVESALKVVFMETIESLSSSILENKHHIGENELYELLGYISHCRINGSRQSLIKLIEKFYIDKDKKNVNNPRYYPRYKVGIGKDVYDYLSKQGIIQGENITHDIYRDVLATRWYFYMIYTTLEYFGLEYLDFTSDGKEKLAMLLESANSDSEAWNNIALAFLSKLDDKVYELCSASTLDQNNKSYPVFDETLSIIFSPNGFSKENIKRIYDLLLKEGFYYGEFIDKFIKK